MALQCKVGSFALNTTTGNQSVSGVGFLPKAIIFFGNDLTADGSSADALLGFGMATSSSNRAAASYMGEDAQTAMDSARMYNGSACYVLVKEDETALVVADLVSMDADGFTINISTASGAANIVNFIALGGDDLTGAFVKTFNAPTSTGSVGYTGVGFQPDALVVFNSGVSSPSTVGNSGINSIGIATGPTARGVISVRIGGGGGGTQINEKQQLTDKIIHTTNGGATFQTADLTSMDADGFTLNWTTVNGARQTFALCLKGGRFKVGSFNQPTSTGNQSVSGVGFTPSGVLLMSWNNASSASLVEDHKLSLGAGSSSSDRASVWTGDQDAVTTQQSNSNLDRTKILKMLAHADSPTTDAAADLVSLDSDGFTLNWTTADATAREILYLVFGSTPTTRFNIMGTVGM